ncbi:MAG: WYL domain-containing protein [Actinomycetota bacterium]|nr:WYL domain-containing protein [Actinomycetota bacterium]
MSSSSVSRTERLLNLVIALLSTRAPLSRASIQAKVAGYDSDATVPAFERMFERDKEELRAMGVPIRTITDAHGEVQGYVVDADEYATADLNLTADEIAVLNLAAQLWDNAVLESAALTAVRKLESTVDEEAATLPNTFGVLTARDAALLPLLRAVRDGRVVRFEYRKPQQDEADKRTVEPWAVHSKNGRWYLAGWDVDRCEERVFRISRIAASVQVTGTDIDSARRSSSSEWDVEIDDDVTAQITVPDGVGAELRRLPQTLSSDGTTFTITEGRQQLLTLLWRADPSVQLIGPQDLRDEYVAGLQRIEQAHR